MTPTEQLKEDMKNQGRHGVFIPQPIEREKQIARESAVTLEKQVEACVSMRWEPQHGDMHEAVRQLIELGVLAAIQAANQQRNDAVRVIVEDIVRRTAQANCAVELNVVSAMREFDLEIAKLS